MDEDLSGFGIALMRLRRDVIVGRRPPAVEVVPKDDPDWIPVVAARGWVVITNDRHIRTRPGEAEQARDAGLLCVCLRPTVKDASSWDFMMVTRTTLAARGRACWSKRSGMAGTSRRQIS
ncbi:MAG: hypothetical protein LC808_12870 [Actinobacteria bacterium]|nr:hypothetical protein [Actinomycetota bacterium]